jgi:hypothetical protein
VGAVQAVLDISEIIGIMLLLLSVADACNVFLLVLQVIYLLPPMM